jgi:hypothetical protein
MKEGSKKRNCKVQYKPRSRMLNTKKRKRKEVVDGSKKEKKQVTRKGAASKRYE